MAISIRARRRWAAVACVIALAVAPLSAHAFVNQRPQRAPKAPAVHVNAPPQPNQPAPTRGFPYDWTHHHLIFSRPALAIARRLQREPRYRIQQAWRARRRRGGAEDYIRALDALAVQLANARTLPVLPPLIWNQPIPVRRLRGDWSVSMGSGAKVGAGRYPAKFSFNPIATPDCTNDFVVFNTGLLGSGSQATVGAFNKLYSGPAASGGCGTSGVPAVYWAYNTGNKIINSVVLSADGSQIAFVHSGTSASLVILRWRAGQGTSFSAPASPNGTSYVSTPDKTTFVNCKTDSTKTCQLSLTFSNNSADTNSAPFPDYSNDIIYVGDDSGVLHKFSGVFNGSPAEVVTSPWPDTVHSSSVLTGPVLDSSVSPPVIYVAEKNSSPGLDAVDTSTGAVTRSRSLGRNSTDIADAPIVDSSAGKIYVGVGNDGSSNSAVFLFNRGFTGATVPSKAVVGAASLFTPLPLYGGDFDNAYFNSASGTGNLYVCGNTGGNPTLYQAQVTATGFGTVKTGPSLASATTTCSPVTEIYNSNATGGPFDWIFLSVAASGSLTNCAGGGCVANFIVTAWQAVTAYVLNQVILDSNLNMQKVTTAGTSGPSQPTWNTTTGGTTSDGGAVWTNQGAMTATAASRAEPGGTSGIIIDNTSSTIGASQVYFSTLSNGTCGSGSGGCAVQASQSALSQ